MIPKSIFFILTFCLTTVAYSQPQIVVGKPYEVINGQGKFYFYKNNELLTVKKDGDQLFIQKLNTITLSYLSTNRYDVYENGFEFIKKIKDRYFMFYSDNRGLTMREIDFEAGKFKNQGRRIISNDEVVGISTTFGAYGIPEKASSKYNIFLSHDDSVVAVQYRLKPTFRDDTKNYETIGLHIFDNDFRELSNATIKMPYTEARSNNLAYCVDSKGNAYVVTSVFEREFTKEEKDSYAELDYHLEVLKITPPDVNLTTIRVDLDGSFVKTIRLFEDSKGAMRGIGFYNKGKKPKSVDGIMQFKLTHDTLRDFRKYDIPLSILNQYASGKTKTKNNEDFHNAEFENLVLSGIVFGKDGSMVILSEQTDKKITYHHTTAYNGAPINAASTSYSDGDMLISKIDSAGGLSWMKKLAKGRVSGSADGSFSYLPGAGEHHVLFLDNMKNFDLPANEKHAINHGWGDILMAYAINDKTGKIRKTAILDLRNVNGIQMHQFTPSRIEAIAPSVFLFEAYIKNDQDTLVKVDLSKN